MAFFLCSEPWVRLKVHVRLTESRNSWSPAYRTSPPKPRCSRGRVHPYLSGSLASTIIQCVKWWSWGWAHILVILVTIGDGSAESEPSVYLGECSCSMVLFSDCPQGYLFMLRELSSWSKDFSIEPDEPFYMKRDSRNLRVKLTRARWTTACRHVTDGASREVLTKSLPSVHRAALSWERLPPYNRVIPSHCPNMWDNSTSGSQEASRLSGAESESLVNWIPFVTGLVSPVLTPHPQNLHFPQDLEMTIHGENRNPTLPLGARFFLGTSVLSELAGLVCDCSSYTDPSYQGFQGFKSTEKCVSLFLPQGPQKEEGCSSLMPGSW